MFGPSFLRGTALSNVIVGAGSFLGSVLKQKLLNSNEIVFDISFRPGDEESFLKSLKNLLEKENIKNLFICGGSQSSSDKLDTLNDLIQSNIFLPTAICSLVRDISDNTKIIFFGSSWQLSDQLDFSPFNLYASSKQSAENMLEHFAMDGLKICSLRLYDTYGKNDKRSKIVNLIADAIKNNKKLDMSEGKQLIDLIHINDVVDGVMHAVSLLEKKESKSLLKFSLKSGSPIQVREIVRIYERILSRDLNYLFNFGYYPYRKRERFSLPTNDKTPEGWSPKIDIEAGLKSLID